MELLERSSALAFLDTRLQDATRSHGSLVFVSGEMGVGKTTLVDRFVSGIHPDVRRIEVPFEGLSIPDPLGPFHDAIRSISPGLLSMLEEGTSRARFFGAFVDEIRGNRVVTLLIAEDIHWADEASLDLLRYLGRRAETLPLIVIATLRDDELPPDHPLRRVLGDLVNVSAVHRLALPTLSLSAVAQMAAGSGLDPNDLHAYTGGNPFYVSEIVASGSRIPMSLQDAILGRAARLSVPDRAVLDAAATIGAWVDVDVLQSVTGENVAQAVDNGLAVGLLRPAANGIAFRHAAVQATLLAALSAPRRKTLHTRILSYLKDDPAYRRDAARLAYHAEECADPAAFSFARSAAMKAAAFHSHREAAEQYARALRTARGLTPADRARMLEARAFSLYLTTRFDDAVAAQEAAARIWDDLGRNLEYGHNLRRLSRFCKFASRHRDALSLAERAHAVLSEFPATREFALACGYLAEWRMTAHAIDEAEDLSRQAMQIATDLDDDAAKAHALITAGAIRLGSGDETGIQELEAGLVLSRELGNEEYELRALTHLAEPPGFRRPAAAIRGRYIAEAMAHAEKHGLDTKIVLFGGMHLRFLLDRAEWSRVIAEAEKLIIHPSASGHYLLEICLAGGLARLRAGEPAGEVLLRATELARQIDGGRHMAAVDAARAEAAWLNGDDPRARAIALEGIGPARASGNIAAAHVLALWAHRAGETSCPFEPVVAPYALEISGNWEAAAAVWDADDVRLEALRARSNATDEGELRSIYRELERIEAYPDARRVSRRLRALGFRPIPPGHRPSTRTTYASLTGREIEILSVLSTGASNRDIAEQLFLSPKTVEHHVSAILAKLGVANRQQAVNQGRDAGLIPK